MADEKNNDDNGSAPNDQRLQRLTIYVGLAKFVIGTVAMGAVTLYFNHQYQNAQLALEEKKSSHAMLLQDKQAEVEYLSKFVINAMDKDFKARTDFADYMQSVALSETLRKIWSNYHDILLKKSAEAEAKLAELEAKQRDVAKKLAEIDPGQSKDSPERVQALGQIQSINRSVLQVQDSLDRKRYGAFEENFFDFADVLNKARAARRMNNYKEELNLLLSAVDRVPKSVQPYVLTELAYSSRALRDFANARKYMEQAVALTSPTAAGLLSLAIMQKNDSRLDLAIQSLTQAASLANAKQKLDIEIVTAGYLIQSGERDKGLRRFEAINDQLVPRDDFIGNLTWFYAVADRKKEFYEALERYFQIKVEQALVWIDEEVDINKFREEDRFKSLVEKAQASRR